MGRLGIFGGTFDPVHHGHLIIAEAFREHLQLSAVLFLPAHTPPHKQGRPITPLQHRLAMLQLALLDEPAFAISYVDAQRAGPSYTADSLALLRQQYPEDELYFLMGQDSLAGLPTWHEPQRVAEQAFLAVAMRPGVSVDLDALYQAVPAARGRVILVSVPLIQIASSDIRQRVAEGRSIRYFVPPAVEAYIVHHGLYRTAANEQQSVAHPDVVSLPHV
ncbi:nicotinate-nucleotide adenylyltransferase [Thermorudis peleae]|uniref:nicotinate-nucleotide adenylyltransferase n=1 Tax=Thermorudis peleae TaxID=1382356 RepID=UPI00068EAAD0|nr:nicotinate-nucleotide adenylyltransferase [Thermorudis peleae]MBX6753560.1 nicotinate-nucleotide adenylyltransferase [Thermorudis peleae]